MESKESPTDAFYVRQTAMRYTVELLASTPYAHRPEVILEVAREITKFLKEG